MSRLPIRVRLTLVLAVAMAIVIAAAGIVSHLVVRRALDHNMRQALSARAADVAALIGGTDDRGAPRHHVLTVRGEAYAQVLDPRGRVLDTTPRLAGVTLLTPAQTAAALRGVLIVDRPGLPGLAHRVRLFATRTIDDGPAVVVVAASLKDRNDTIRAISLMALIGGGITLLAVAVAGYWVAAAALRPVEGMRRMAEAISGAPGVQRLPLPAARDEIRGLGVTLNSMLDRVERAARHQRAFVADAGHELRTPLAILTTELELAQHPSATEADLRAAVSSAAEETERLVQLSDDLLTVAHADSGTIPVHREAVDVPDLLERLATRFGGRATAGGRTITVDAPGMPPAWVDPMRLRQAVGNLLDNALRHGGGVVHLTARRPDEDLLEVAVEDDGPGMPEDFVERAFDRFTRANPARQRGGSGLGLSITQAIARAHGGEARIERFHDGLRIVVRVPCGAPDAGDDPG